MYTLGEMKRLLACLFLVLSLGLAFSVNTNASAELLKSALDIDKKEKIKFLAFAGTYFVGSTFLIDDLRGNGPVYYKFLMEQYYRLDKNFNVISEGTYVVPQDKGVFKLKEGKLKFQWKISILDKVVDIKSKFYKYRGFKRYHIKQLTKQQIKNVKQSVINFRKNQYAGYDDSDDNLN